MTAAPGKPVPNNPTLCSVRKPPKGEPCGCYSSHVFISAHVTRLVCDACARSYRANGIQAPVLEYSLAELVPAREALLVRLTLAEDREKRARLLYHPGFIFGGNAG